MVSQVPSPCICRTPARGYRLHPQPQTDWAHKAGDCKGHLGHTERALKTGLRPVRRRPLDGTHLPQEGALCPQRGGSSTEPRKEA